MDNFCNLHNHCTYSFLDGYGHPKDWAARAKELNQSAIAISDHGNIFAHQKWIKACEKNEVKPILGCEFYIVDDLEKKDRRLEHVTVLVENGVGYKNLIKLVTLSHEHMYYKPRISWNLLIENQEGLIVLSGDLMGKLANSISNNEPKTEDKAKYLAKSFKNFFIELSAWENPVGIRVGEELYKLAKKLKLPTVLTVDAHYPLRHQYEIQDVLMAIQTNSKFDDKTRYRLNSTSLYLKTREEAKRDWLALHPDCPIEDALDNTIRIAEMVNFKFPETAPIKFPTTKNKKQMLVELCRKGMDEFGLSGNDVYEERLKRELELMEFKKYIDYFLVIIELIQWAKKQGIFVGGGRGSAAGSLVCFVTKVTTVDPLKYDLLFERFIDINRNDLPDVDIDFEDERRDEVKKHLEEFYGKDRVSNLSTFGTYKGKMCIFDLGRVFSIPKQDVDTVKRLMIERSGGDSRFSLTVEDTFENFEEVKKIVEKYPVLNFAKQLEGQVRHVSVHAAGIIISNQPITDVAAFLPTAKGRSMSMDYEDASGIGLVKIDLLGLNTLSALKRMIELVRLNKNVNIEPLKIPLDDENVYQRFSDGKTFGIFQYDGTAVQQVCKASKPHNFSELCDINALGRPGALHSGGTTSYIARKHGKEKIVYLHPFVKELTKDTFGVTIYQEQVMRIVREIGQFSWEDTSTVRRIMSRRMGDQAFGKYKIKFIEGATKQGVEEKIAEEIWSTVYTHGSWCVSGDAKIIVCGQNSFVKNKEMTIRQLYKNNGYATPKWKYQPDTYKKVKLLSVDYDGKIRPARIKNVYFNGIRETREVITEKGKRIKATLNHKFLTNKGYLELSKLKRGDFIAVNGGIDQQIQSHSKKGKSWAKGLKWKNGRPPMIDGRTAEKKKFRREKIGKPCDHCAEQHRRMEVHHVTHNAPNSILEWLCPGCHKKTEYAQGRTKVWEKGFKVEFEKIIRIAKYRDKKRAHDVYDVEMEDNNKPNFIVNDFVSHNSFNRSHSVCYTFLGYYLMWFRVNFPIEFFAAMCEKSTDEKKVKRILKEYIQEGYELAPIDINESKVSFTVNDDKLRLGFQQVHGIGLITARKIIENQPYESYSGFCRIMFKASAGGKKTRTILRELGAFQNLPYGGGNQLSMFRLTEDLEGESLSLQPQAIQMYCPLMNTENVFEKWNKKVIERYGIKPIQLKDLETAPIKTKLYIIGKTNPTTDFNIKNEFEEAMSRGLKYEIPVGKTISDLDKLNFEVEDETDFVTCRIQKDLMPKLKGKIFSVKPENTLLIEGITYAEIRMFFVSNIVILERVNWQKKTDE